MRQILTLVLLLSLSSFYSTRAQSPGNVGTSDLFMWLKADSGISTTDNGDPVAFWEDQGPNGNDAVQTDPLAQPLFNTKRINGYPALRFNNTSRFMNIPLDALSDGDFTVFVVAKRTNANANSFLMATTGSAGVGFEWGLPNETSLSAEQFSSSNTLTVPAFSSDEVPMILQASNSPVSGINNMVSRSGVNFNGSDFASTGTDALVGFLGKNDSGQGFRGHIAEVIIYDRELIFSEINAIRTYLATKYGMTIVLSENNNFSDASFNHGTFGLEKDADQDIDMTGSESEEPSTIAKVRSISTMNEDEFLMIGHNNQAINFTASGLRCGMDEKCDREWKMESNFIPNNMKVQFDFTDFPSVDLEKTYLLIDFNNNGYADDKIIYGTISGSKITFTMKGISNGNTFTIGTGDTKWTAMTSGLSSDPIWSPTASTSDLQTVPSCQHFQYTVRSSATVDMDTDMEMLILDIQGTLHLNNHKLTIYQDLTNDGTLNSGTSNVTFEGPERLRLRGSSITNLYNLTYNGDLDFRVQVPELRMENIVRIENGIFKTNNKVVLLSTAARTAMIGPITGTGTVSGKITAQRFHNAENNGYVMLGTPIRSQEITDLNDDLTTTGFVGSDWPDYPFNNIKAYDESLSGLKDEGFVGTTGLGQNLSKGKGWMIYMAEGSQFIDLNGSIWMGDQNLPVSYTDTSNPLEDGWNLVANPYACTINWDVSTPAWTKTNIEDAIYVFDAELQVYSSYVNGVGNNGGSGNIAPFQAFWVKANADAPELMITEQAKNPIQVDFKDAPATPLRLAIGSGTHIDETTFYWSSDATAGFDSELEAEKFYIGETTTIASITENGMALSIQALSESAGDINIPLEVVIHNNRPWSFSAEGWDQIHNGRCVYMHDAESNMRYPLTNGEFASIELEAGTYTDRFSLRVTSSALTQMSNPSCFGVNDGSISVANVSMTQVEWFNSNNELLLAGDMNESTLNNLSPGVYHVVMTSNGVCPSFSLNIALVEPMPLSADNEIILPSCPNSSDGAIIMENSGGTDPYQFNWSTENEDASIYNIGVGNYELTLVDANGCELYQSFDLPAANNPQVHFTTDPVFVLEGGIAVVPFENNSTGVENFVWSLGDGNSSIEEQLTHVYNEPGNYIVTLTGTAGECTQTWEQEISVQFPVGVSNTNLEEQTKVTWSEQGISILQGSDHQPLMVNIYNVLGQKLAETSSADQQLFLKIPPYIQHVLIEIQTLDGSGRVTYNLAK